MKFGVLALDYDGTIACEGVLNLEVKAAIVEVRARGIVVIIVSGRILSDLKRVAGNLDFVDAVVAENGAVLSFPNGQTRLLVIARLKHSSTHYAAAESNSNWANVSLKAMLLRPRRFWPSSGNSSYRARSVVQ